MVDGHRRDHRRRAGSAATTRRARRAPSSTRRPRRRPASSSCASFGIVVGVPEAVPAAASSAQRRELERPPSHGRSNDGHTENSIAADRTPVPYDPRRPMADPSTTSWEDARRLVDRRVHRRRRPRVRGADPAARRRGAARRARGSSTSAAATARSAAWPRQLGAELVVGVDPTWNQIRVAARARRRPGVRSAPARRSCRSPTRSFDAVVACLVFEHIRDVDEAIAEVGPGAAPGGRFCFFLNHPLLQTPNSGWIDDQVLDPPEQYWRIGPYLVEDETIEEVEKDVFIPFIHRPLSRYVNALADDGPAARADGRAGAAAGLPRPRRGVRGRRRRSRGCCTCGRASTSRSQRADRTLQRDRHPRDHRAVRRRAVAGADVLEDLGWFVVDNLPTRAARQDRRAGQRARARASSGWRSSSADRQHVDELLDAVAALRAPATGCACCSSTRRRRSSSAATAAPAASTRSTTARAAWPRRSSASARCSSR